MEYGWKRGRTGVGPFGSKSGLANSGLDEDCGGGAGAGAGFLDEDEDEEKRPRARPERVGTEYFL